MAAAAAAWNSCEAWQLVLMCLGPLQKELFAKPLLLLLLHR